MGPARRPLAERFWAKVDKRGPDECWPWLGAKDGGGYGQITKGGHGGKILKAHRVAWSLKNGPIPQGIEICHSCDNPPCCNDAHLFDGTHLDNVADMVKKGRANPPRGEMHSSAKLTAVQVEEIRRAIGTQRAIAARFGISPTHVFGIKHGKAWAPSKPTTPLSGAQP